MFQLPTKSRLFRALEPSNNWDWQEMLLNKATYLLEVLAWQQTKDAQKGRRSTAPKMYTPDFMKQAAKKNLDPDQALYTTDQIKDILAKPRKKQG
jgi:hypothetical protein